MSCPAKHVKYQPTDDEWGCPKCKVGSETPTVQTGFIIECASGDAAEDCPLLHKEDELRCYNCGYVCSGETYSKYLVKKHNLIPCSCCNGTGFIKKTEPESAK